MEYDEYLKIIAWTTVQMMGETVKVIVTPAAQPRTFEVRIRLKSGARASFEIQVPWHHEKADPDELRQHVQAAVRKWQLEYLSRRQPGTTAPN